jgi:hypothetical protein
LLDLCYRSSTGSFCDAASHRVLWLPRLVAMCPHPCHDAPHCRRGAVSFGLRKSCLKIVDTAASAYDYHTTLGPFLEVHTVSNDFYPDCTKKDHLAIVEPSSLSLKSLHCASPPQLTMDDRFTLIGLEGCVIWKPMRRGLYAMYLYERLQSITILSVPSRSTQLSLSTEA